MLHNSTPHSTTGVAPSVSMFGRSLRNKLPSVLNAERGDIEEALEYKIVGAKYADKCRHVQPSRIQKGDVVVIISYQVIRKNCK